jgi:hypothetical protein
MSRPIVGLEAKNPRLSFEEFLKSMSGYQKEMKSICDILSYTFKLFSERNDIWPDQCDRVITLLQTMQDTIYNLLDTTERLPLSVSPLRYPLRKSLHQFNRLMSELTTLVIAYRASCQRPSTQIANQRHEIQLKTSLLSESGEDVLENIHILRDQAYFCHS